MRAAGIWDDGAVGRGILIGLLALGATLACASASASPGQLLDVGRDNGLPVAFAKGRAESPRTLLVRVRAKPRRRVEVTWDTNCALGGKGKVREGRYTIEGTKLRRLGKGFRRPDDCLVNMIAAYEDAEQAGKLKIELYAR